ncbi:MAG: T9SS type A sorting domain-containing protein [Bacteroidota bacterium]
MINVSHRPEGRTQAFVRCVLALLIAGSGAATGGQFHVHPGGSPMGDGSATRPWDLRTALTQTAVVLPGDTVWLHGGRYWGTFESFLTGTPAAPIFVRSYPGEWAVIDNGGSNDMALWLKGGYTWFWGLEVTNSNPSPPRNEGGVNFTSSIGNKLINALVHDMGSTGINPYVPSIDAEIYGCLVYYNGRFDDTNRVNGYGIYGQNAAPSRKLIADNFFFNMFGVFPAHMAGSSTAKIDGMSFEGNVIFGHTLYDGKNVIAVYGNFEPGAGKNLEPEWKSNFFYRSDLWLGYNGDGVDSATVTGNIFYRGELSEHPANTYRLKADNVLTSDEDTVIVRPNRFADSYDPRRANIVVLNGRGAMQVTVKLPPGVLVPGDSFQVRDVQNYLGPPVAAGVFTDSIIVIPMPGSSSPIMQPRSIPAHRPGSSLPSHTDREFGAFVLLANLQRGDWPLAVGGSPYVGEYALAQNYPNPFNPSTTITFMLSARTYVRLSVTNILGQEVSTLVDGMLEAGNHSAVFDGLRSASGVYFYRLVAGDHSYVKRMVLLR